MTNTQPLITRESWTLVQDFLWSTAHAGWTESDPERYGASLTRLVWRIRMHARNGRLS